MTIHHDKLAYGRLASNMEEMTEKQIAEMLEQLSAREEQDGKEKPQEEEK